MIANVRIPVIATATAKPVRSITAKTDQEQTAASNPITGSKNN